MPRAVITEEDGHGLPIRGGLSGETRLRELLVGHTLNSLAVKSKQDIKTNFTVQLLQEEYRLLERAIMAMVNKIRRDLPAQYHHKDLRQRVI